MDKNEMREKIKAMINEDALSIAFWFKASKGLPEDIFFERFAELDTIGKQINFCFDFDRKHKGICKHFVDVI